MFRYSIHPPSPLPVLVIYRFTEPKISIVDPDCLNPDPDPVVLFLFSSDMFFIRLTFFRIPGHTKDLPKDIDEEARRRRRLVVASRGRADGPLVTPSSGIYEMFHVTRHTYCTCTNL